ncbi:unnamed protein product, partial [Brenthis ino]
MKLETEIKLAEQEVKSLLIALETINLGNVELQKEILLAKERNIATSERVNNGINKYEQLWLTSKKRYESIPFIQKCLQIINKKDTLQDNINKLIKEKQKLLHDVVIKQRDLLNLDRKNIIEMAKYMVHERPLTLKQIKNKQNEVSELLKEIKVLSNPNENINLLKTDLKIDSNAASKILNPPIEDNWLNISENGDNEVITIKKVDYQKLSIKRVDSEPLVDQTKRIKTDEIVKDLYISTYFQKREDSVDLKSNYSDKKLIHVLEDIKLDKAEALEIVSKVKCSVLQNVETIEAAQREKINSSQETVNNKSVDNMEEIVEIDLTNKESLDVLMPPTQFLDLTQEEFIKSSQGQVETEKNNTKETTNNKSCSQEKRVTFTGIVSVTNSETIDLQKSPESVNQLDISTTSDDSYKKIKEIIFKKHNLDLSPEFTYSKIPATSMRPETNAVTSKFFDTKINNDENKVELMEVDNSPTGEIESNQCVEDKINENVVSESNEETKNDPQKGTVAGFLFAHGPQGIPDSLNVSVSTLDYEDADCAPCIDSNLLLSPKADEQMPTTSENIKVLSQEVPNFLSGLRRTGLSFFGNTLSEDKSSTSTQNQNCNFTFSFGGDDKMTRGGLFSMFR